MKTRRIAFLLLAVAMLFALAVPAFAAAEPPTKGTITIQNALLSSSNPNDYTTSMPDYTLYRLFDATVAYNEDGTVKGVSYTCTDAQKDIAGIETYFVISGNNVTGTTEAGTGEEGKLSPAAVQWVREHISDLCSEPVSVQKKPAQDNGQPWYTVVTGQNASVTFGNLPFGYYFIDNAVGSVVMINSACPEATVQEKNLPPDLTKTITSFTNADGKDHSEDIIHEDPDNNIFSEMGTFQLGDTVEYNVAVTARPGARNYRLFDCQSRGLTLQPDTIVIKKDGVAIDESNYTLYTAVNPQNLWTRYTRDEAGIYHYDLYRGQQGQPEGDPIARDIYQSTSAKALIYPYTTNILVLFHQDYLDTITEEAALTLSYKCVVNDEASVASGAYGIVGENNSVYLDYGRGYTRLYDPASILSARIVVYKFEGDGDSSSAGTRPLSGVKFILQNSEGKYLKQGDDGSTRAIHWVDSLSDATVFVTGTRPMITNQTIVLPPEPRTIVSQSAEKIVFTVPDVEGTYELLPGADGQFWNGDDIVFYEGYGFTAGPDGVWGSDDETVTMPGYLQIEGLTNGTYTLIETEALPGYNKAPDTTITISNRTNTYQELHKQVNIANKTGSVLPNTGGTGATAIYAAGMLLLLCAGYVLLRKRRTESA